MPKRKVQFPFVTGFSVPNENDVLKAMGTFPFEGAEVTGAKHRKREDILLGVSGGNNTTLASLQQCDQESLFVNNFKGKKFWDSLPSPMDETAWLAHVNEEGQTFQQYVSATTLRSGQFRPNTNHLQTKIYILPIVDHEDVPSWPTTGPDLQGLAAWMSAFFSRDVEILDFVTLRPHLQDDTRKRKAKQKIVWQAKDDERLLAGRFCEDTGRYQTHVEGLLCALSGQREEGSYGGTSLQDAFSVVGVTMCDLYSGATDLFVAGMAAGGSKVAVLSFARYHPMLKMCPEKWQDYGYTKRSSSYSYFEDNKPRPVTSPDVSEVALPAQAQAEYFRRAGKLLIHEMCHVYGIDHCIHYHCLMNGTAHLVEDFASPCHVCCVCLRKLQFRLGFDIKKRYQDLHDIFRDFGMKEQVKWTARKLACISEGDEEKEEKEEGQEGAVICVDLTEEEE